MSSGWPDDGSSGGRRIGDVQKAASRDALGWYDPRRISGAKCDLRPIGAVVTTAGSPVITYASSSLAGSNGDVNKLLRVSGGGVTLRSGSCSMTAGAVQGTPNSNIVTDPSGNFDDSLLGRRITIAGAGAGGVRIVSEVWGVISPTQLRILVNASTTVSGAAYTIADDLYATVITSTTTQATLDTSAGTSDSGMTAYVSSPSDGALVNDCIQQALADGRTYGFAPTVTLPRAFGLETPLVVTGNKIRILGHGTSGFSNRLSQGGTQIRAMVPKLPSLIKAMFVFNGAPAPVNGSGMGVRGTILTGSLSTLTDPDGHGLVTADAGKKISIVGAGAQLGSQTENLHITTIASVDSTTQVTLAAPAITPVAGAVYSWFHASVANAFSWLALERFHLVGSSGQKCGLHLVASSIEMRQVTSSDFRSGCAVYNDPTLFSTPTESVHDSCSWNDSRIGYKGAFIASGVTTVDGNSNALTAPGDGTVGIDSGSCYATGLVVVQSYDDLFRGEGRCIVETLRCEQGKRYCVLKGDGTPFGGGVGHDIRITSVSSANSFGTAARGLVLMPGTRDGKIRVDFLVPANIGMYTDCDPTALSLYEISDPYMEGVQSVAYSASYAPAGAGFAADLALGKIIKMTLTGAIQVMPPIHATKGKRITYAFKQDTTANRAATWDPIFKVSATPAPALTNGLTNSWSFVWDGTNWVQDGSAVGL